MKNKLLTTVRGKDSLNEIISQTNTPTNTKSKGNDLNSKNSPKAEKPNYMNPIHQSKAANDEQ